MRYVRLGDSDLVVSVVALGCGNFGGVGSAPELFGQGETEPEAHALLDAAYSAGITLLDTANSYGGGRSEDWLGRWLNSRGVRDQVVITTKVGNAVGPADTDRGLSAAHIRSQAEASLRRLHTDRIDLYLTHAPDPQTPIEETLSAFNDLVLSGKIRHFGFSNIGAAQLTRTVEAADRAGSHRPINLQTGHSLLEPAPADTLDVSSKLGVSITAYSPLAGGWLARDYRPNQPYPAGSRMTLRPEPYRDFETATIYDAVQRLRDEADRRGISLPTLGLSWALSDPAIAAVIAGPRTPEHLAPVIAAVDIQLDESDHAAIGALVGM